MNKHILSHLSGEIQMTTLSIQNDNIDSKIDLVNLLSTPWPEQRFPKCGRLALDSQDTHTSSPDLKAEIFFLDFRIWKKYLLCLGSNKTRMSKVRSKSLSFILNFHLDGELTSLYFSCTLSLPLPLWRRCSTWQHFSSSQLTKTTERSLDFALVGEQYGRLLIWMTVELNSSILKKKDWSAVIWRERSPYAW